MTINKELQALKAYSCPDRCVLSVYLNTNPADPDTTKRCMENPLEKRLKTNW